MQCTCFFPPQAFQTSLWQLFIYLYLYPKTRWIKVCCCLVAQLCPTLFDPMDCTPGFPVLHCIGVCRNSCPLIWWCHPTISSSVAPFSSCLQSFPASGSFPRAYYFNILFSVCSQCINSEEIWCAYKQNNNIKTLSALLPWGSFLHSIKCLEEAGVDISEPCKELYLFIWVLAAHVRSFSCSILILVPSPGIEPGPSALGEGSLSHWTTREVL